jgi:hypothetical protein
MPGGSSSGAQAYLDRVTAFADRDLRPEAEAMDTDSRLIEARYERFRRSASTSAGRPSSRFHRANFARSWPR